MLEVETTSDTPVDVPQILGDGLGCAQTPDGAHRTCNTHRAVCLSGSPMAEHHNSTDVDVQIALLFDACQGRDVSNQERGLIALADQGGCCSSLVGAPLSANEAARLSKLFKAMGDPVRLRLLSLIGSHEGGEACVCDLSGVFELTSPTISHHLKVLREAGLISGDRRGTWIYYRVQPDALQRVADILVAGGVVQQGGTAC